MVAVAENLITRNDANGNLTADGTYTFEYDAFNRLVKVKKGTAVTAVYLYDASNRRIKKIQQSDVEYQYVYGGWQVLEEYYSVPAKEYFDNLYRRFTYGEYIDEPVVMECDKNLDGDFADTNEVVYYAQNNTYNVAALFDASGAIVEHYKYDPYGKVTIYTGKGVDGVWFTSDDVTSSVSAVGNPYTFTGRRLDDETGLMYFRNRYYSVDLGRFISRDALEYIDGWNLYRGYFAVNGMDPWGNVGKGFAATAQLSQECQDALAKFMQLKNYFIKLMDLRVRLLGFRQDAADRHQQAEQAITDLLGNVPEGLPGGQAIAMLADIRRAASTLHKFGMFAGTGAGNVLSNANHPVLALAAWLYSGFTAPHQISQNIAAQNWRLQLAVQVANSTFYNIRREEMHARLEENYNQLSGARDRATKLLLFLIEKCCIKSDDLPISWMNQKIKRLD